MRQTIFITGASSGIGLATAKLFQAKGWNVVATMRKPEAAGDLAGLGNMFVTRLDVTDSAWIDRAVNAALKRFGQIDVLLNNAGDGPYGPLENFSEDRIRRQFDTNVIGVLLVTRAVLPHMRARRSGTIVNISSIGGQMTFTLGSLYHSTKFAVEGLSEALHFELASLGIGVKIIEPGMIATDFAGRSFDFANDPPIDEYQDIVGKVMEAFASNPMPPSPPELVADVIFGAVTDKQSRLRYRAGDDANALLDYRKDADDDAFLAGIKAQFGL